eukprot:CAMPEP_0114266606 /NCGR_PEP_ID=MMETSP0058-20121206/24726_1 /TAXON_ID=36894 /ORGANISM="Pyramimonas parkeae, CCMP726" /LENGTH=136 /DNA_ID=CAMNT_0001384151 /DNA_START=379 /DNA_END=787 /DNA_ORIENTATION=-
MEAMNVENNRNPLYDAQYIQLLPGVGVQSSFEDETVNKTCKLLMQVAIITFVWQLLDVIRFVVVNPEVGAIVFVTIAVTFNSMLMWLAHGATTKKKQPSGSAGAVVKPPGSTPTSASSSSCWCYPSWTSSSHASVW